MNRWQTIKQYWQKSLGNKVIAVLLLALLIFFVVSIIGDYLGIWYFNWTGVGDYRPPSGLSVDAERGKTLWDWLDLLIIPIVLAVGGFLLNRAQRQSEQKIADEQRKQEHELAEKIREQERIIARDSEEERALQNYLEAMTELLLERDLRKSPEGSEVRSIGRARTLTVLRGMKDAVRKGSLLRFLHESRLINKEEPIISLSGVGLGELVLGFADLRGVNVNGADLSGADLSGADLRQADLRRVDLRGADLQGADLRGAILYVVDLNELDQLGEGVSLSTANLREANLSRANLSGVIWGGISLFRANLSGANLSGTVWGNKVETKDVNGNFVSGSYHPASLSKANLTKADLREADLRSVFLDGADLREADLRGANLSGASELDSADLRGARYDNRTIWPKYPPDFNPKEAGAINLEE